MSYILLILGFILLVKGADFFVDGSSNLARWLKIPTLIIGLTIVAFGTSAPEAAVSVTASLNGKNAISIGNVIGSNICNLLLVLGFSAMYHPLKAKKKVIVRDYMFSLLADIVLIVMVADSFIKGETVSILSRSEGVLLLCFLGIYLYSLILDCLNHKKLEVEKHRFSVKDFLFIIMGVLGILIGGNLVVNAAVDIAKSYHVSEHLIALTIVAIGTSLPELVTSVIAARKKETDIAIGNVIGSNIFNIFFILGLSSTISPLSVSMASLIDMIIMMVVGIIVYMMVLKNYQIGKKKGMIMLGMYVLYTIYIIIR